MRTDNGDHNACKRSNQEQNPDHKCSENKGEEYNREKRGGYQCGRARFRWCYSIRWFDYRPGSCEAEIGEVIAYGAFVRAVVEVDEVAILQINNSNNFGGLPIDIILIINPILNYELKLKPIWTLTTCTLKKIESYRVVAHPLQIAAAPYLIALEREGNGVAWIELFN